MPQVTTWWNHEPSVWLSQLFPLRFSTSLGETWQLTILLMLEMFPLTLLSLSLLHRVTGACIHLNKHVCVSHSGSTLPALQWASTQGGWFFSDVFTICSSDWESEHEKKKKEKKTSAVVCASKGINKTPFRAGNCIGRCQEWCWLLLAEGPKHLRLYQINYRLKASVCWLGLSFLFIFHFFFVSLFVFFFSLEKVNKYIGTNMLEKYEIVSCIAPKV